MKTLLTACVAALLILPASATINVNWVSSGPIFVAGGSATVPGDLLPAGATFQLIWSPDNVAGGIDASNPLTPTGNDVVINTVSGIAGDIPDTNATYGDAANPPVLPGEGNGGFVYARVFSDGTANPEFFAQTDVVGPTPALGATPTPVQVDFTDPTNSEASPMTLVTLPNGAEVSLNVLFVDTPIIPEPGSLALIALGSILLVAFRRRR